MTQKKIEYWVIPPKADAEFAARMEEVLDVYARPYNPKIPVTCMDELAIQLHQEVRPPSTGHSTSTMPAPNSHRYTRI
jgi:hypothetical protein